MRTTFVIPEKLIAEAKKTAGVKTKTQAVILALEEFIQRRKSRRVLEFRGTLKSNYDHKPLRMKR